MFPLTDTPTHTSHLPQVLPPPSTCGWYLPQRPCTLEPAQCSSADCMSGCYCHGRLWLLLRLLLLLLLLLMPPQISIQALGLAHRLSD